MFVFIKQADDILDSLGVPHEDPRAETQVIDDGDSDLEEFKQFVMKYIQDHDELPADHPAVGQINNTSALDQIEAFLRANLDYCDDCMLKLYRRYASGNKQPEDCPCE